MVGSPTKKVLMIAYFFPPVGGLGAAGSQRTLKFAKYLRRHRWEPVILTVREDCYESYFALDTSLLLRVPPGLKIIRTYVIRWLTKLLEIKSRFRANPAEKNHPTKTSSNGSRVQGGRRNWYQVLKDGLTGLFDIPDDQIGWFLPGFVGGVRAVRREAVDVIFSTGKPWTAHLIGMALKRWTGKPLVVDFRDPWLTNPFRDGSNTFRNRVEAYLEKRVVEIADLVVANTATLKDEFLSRFPQQPPDKFVVLLNGFDPDDFGGATNKRADLAGQFIVTHTGFLYGRRDPRQFLEALALLLETQRIDRDRIKISLVGSVDLPYDLPEYLRARRLDGVVNLVEQVTYQDSLEYLRNSDALLLLQPGTKTQIPSKLFEYIALGKPILAVSPSDGATSQLVAGESIGVAAEAEDISAIASAIEKLYQAWESGSKTHTANGYAREKFDVKNVTAALSRKFNELATRRLEE
jgi:glycosyltransferase involved in cell wall biosynthesis